MNILDDLKLQYKLGGIALRVMYWNVACFIVSLIFFFQYSVGQFAFPDWLALSSNPDVFLYRPWTFLTYAFFHDGFWHLLFNMMVLNFSSTLFLTYFTQKQYLGLYILSAIFAGVVLLGIFGSLQKIFLVKNVFSAGNPIAVAGIFAIVVFGGIYFFRDGAQVMAGIFR